MKVEKIITIAGNLDHERWTEYHHLPSLTASLALKGYQEAFMGFDQVHFVGQKDSNIPPFLVRSFVGDRYPVFEIKGATHSRGWEKSFSQIWNE